MDTRPIIITKAATCFLALVAALLFVTPRAASAAASATLGPPIVTVYAPTLSNNEIFYIGGTTAQAEATVVVYLQADDGSILSREVSTDGTGAWFYTYPEFLRRGNYRVWTQLRVKDSVSPPSAQLVVAVVSTALQIGRLRLSYESVFLWITLILALAIVLLVVANVALWRRTRRKRERLEKEIAEAEEAVRRGFELLHRDITAELAMVKRARFSRELSAVEREREEKLLKDLGLVETYVAREVADIERALKPGRA